MFIKIKQSFSAKLHFYLLLSLFLLFVVVFGSFYYYARGYIQRDTYAEMQRMTERAGMQVANIMQTVESIPLHIGWIMPEEKMHPDSIPSITYKVVSSYSQLFSCVVAFEPDYYPRKEDYPTLYSYRKDGQIITREIDSTIPYREQDWYRIPKETDKDAWSTAYYEIGDEWIKNSAYSVPIHADNGDFIGVFSIVLSTEWLKETMDSYAPYRSSNIIVINNKGNYMFSGQNYQLQETPKLFRFTSKQEDTAILSVAQQIAQKGENEQYYHKSIRSYVFSTAVNNDGWSLIVFYSRDEMFKNIHYFHIIVLISFCLILLFVSLISYVTVRKITQPLRNFIHKTKQITEEDIYAPLPNIQTEDEMQELHNTFVNMQTKMKSYASHLEESEAEKAIMDRELRLAQNIQKGLLSRDFMHFPVRNDLDFHAATYPAQLVGGDFYDFYYHENSFYFAIGDVSGKGIPASLLMAVTMSLLRSIPSKNASPSSIVSYVNKNISEYNEAEMFVTLLVGRLNLKTGQLTYCNAGHLSPIIGYPDGRVDILKLHSELPAGILKEQKYTDHKITVPSGAGLVFFTDGVTDAQNCSGDFYSEERLIKLVQNNNYLHPKEFVAEIVEDLKKHKGMCEQTDDYTLFTMIYGEEWAHSKTPETE